MTIIRVVKKFDKVLSRHQRKRVAQLILIMVLGGIFEMCSVSIIIPFMNCVMNPDEMMQNKYIILLCSVLDIESSNTVLLIIAITLAAIYMIKNLYMIFQYSIQYKFVYNNMFEMQSKLFFSYLSRPYEYFMNINSAEIIRIITSDTVYAFNTLILILQLFSEIVISGMLIVALFLIAPEITILMALIFVILVMAVNSIVKPILRTAGRNQQVAGTGMNKWLLQSLQGIKDLKITESESYFKKNFDKSGYAYAQAFRKNQTFSYIPKFLIEGISYGAIFICIAILIGKGTQLQVILPILSAVAMASIRLLPSVNRISTSVAQIEYNETMVDKMIENMKIFKDKCELSDYHYNDSVSRNNEVPEFSREISFQNVFYRYQNSKEDVLSNLNFNIKKNSSIGIVGASGSGKSTTVDLLLGLLKPRIGKILVDGIDINIDKKGWHDQIGYIPQTISMLDDTIKANIAFAVDEEKIDEEKIWKALREASLDKFVKELPEGLDTKIGERGIRISGGQRQRIGIARALYRDPKILIFDEATSALDGKTEGEIMNSIYGLNKDKTLIIIAHRVSTLDRCDCVYKVEKGKITRER